MQFLWKSQLKKERGKFLPQDVSTSKRASRKERLESKRKFSSQNYLGVYALWVSFFGTVVYLVLFSSYLTLQEPSVIGLKNIRSDMFRSTIDDIVNQKYFGLFSRNRYFLVRPSSFEELLRKRYPLILEVEVRPIFPESLVINVKERESILLWCSGETCTHVQESGNVLPINDAYQEEENKSRTITIRDLSGKSLLPGDRITELELVTFPDELRQSLRDQFSLETTSEMTLSSRFASELRVKTEEGWEIFFSTEIPVADSLEALELFFEKELQPERRRDLWYIDLRTENRIFYRYQEGKEDSEQSKENEVISQQGREKKEGAKKKKE